MTKHQAPYGDIKYFRGVHVHKMKQLKLPHVGYGAFSTRLIRGMSLHDAICTPANKAKLESYHKTCSYFPCTDQERRLTALKLSNVDLEQHTLFDYTATPTEPVEQPKKRNRIRRPVKRTWFEKLLLRFKRK